MHKLRRTVFTYSLLITTCSYAKRIANFALVIIVSYRNGKVFSTTSPCPPCQRVSIVKVLYALKYFHLLPLPLNKGRGRGEVVAGKEKNGAYNHILPQPLSAIKRGKYRYDSFTTGFTRGYYMFPLQGKMPPVNVFFRPFINT